jgi:hypothetical protein
VKPVGLQQNFVFRNRFCQSPNSPSACRASAFFTNSRESARRIKVKEKAELVSPALNVAGLGAESRAVVRV